MEIVPVVNVNVKYVELRNTESEEKRRSKKMESWKESLRNSFCKDMRLNPLLLKCLM